MNSIQNIKWILYKEASAFFGSNLPLISTAIIAFLCGLISVIIALSQGATYDDITHVIFYMFYVIIMAAAGFFSMNSFVGEKRSGTLELLYTLPVSDADLVIGKFLFGAIYCAFVSVCISLVYILFIASAPWYITLTGIVGLFLVGLYATGIALFSSAMTETPFGAALITAGILIFIDVGGFMAGLLPSPGKEIFIHMHSLNQFNAFTRGVFSLKSITYFVSMTALCLFLSIRVLESRRWKR